MARQYLRSYFRSNVFISMLLAAGLGITIASFYFDGQRSTKPLEIDWQILSQVKFNSIWYAPYRATVKMPAFSDTLIRLNGKEVEITGYFIPMELNGHECALSKNPNRTCFFCGRSTIETILIVDFKDRSPNFSSDDLITVRGKIKITPSFNDFIYRVADATFVRIN
ncbi:MAG TPA: hypothetical protein VHE34_05690 [Puia sp.]|uniref:hypothetical protein n=1 Tax=Puia sp. TaxID=2045100 RepID=UPI002C64513C|nr:hypothetical protein [Puia sp.]HVU94693.1 hypothetical protein [Puia sp.]